MAHNKLYDCEMTWYKVKYPLDETPFLAALHTIAPDNLLSVNVHQAGVMALVKAPAGVVSADIMQEYDNPPVGLVNAPPWSSQ